MSDKICIVGPGRCGKDSAGVFFGRHLGLPYAGSTSWSALPLMADFLGDHPQIAWEERHQHREIWKRQCDEFRRDNPLFLIQRAFATTPGGRVITGLRDKAEILAARQQRFFRHILWVDRSGTPEDPTVTFCAADATDYVRNDGTLRRFHRNLIVWALSVNLDVTLSKPARELLEDLDPE